MASLRPREPTIGPLSDTENTSKLAIFGQKWPLFEPKNEFFKPKNDKTVILSFGPPNGQKR